MMFSCLERGVLMQTNQVCMQPSTQSTHLVSIPNTLTLWCPPPVCPPLPSSHLVPPPPGVVPLGGTELAELVVDVQAL